MKLENLKEDFGSLWDNIADGWRHLKASAAGALTRFKPGEKTNLPDTADVDDDFFVPGGSWAMLNGDMFEDENRLVVKLELPGMSKEDIDIEIHDDALVISGDKRFESERSQGRWRVMQCAYGSFRRVVPLPTSVKLDEVRASYKNGVLRVDLPKANPSKPKGTTIKVN